ncbi:MAG TPA: NAD(P)H-hydrate dehydratase [Segeticoccus sp.]|uniref:bifunctional ADP-dependent NAD(P)H-hydrate dehydratase/NAD(P)H-hydrate epimerase n=1 Tax=Segeticoccus sp. TaxID=2706531 RepID=UPI002D7FD186|nr:NAD(P)H-hydrate dehydratase [Segeticoccus sp.]HET8599417.1 NAD(P)H-hydrate dehydratase [Segeticoccus sp.]
MIEAYAVPDVRAAERLAMGRLPDGELMQRAATGLAEVVAARLGEHRPSAQPGTVVVLVGPGDNGGDALYAGARLADRFPVTAVPVTAKTHEAGLAAARAAGVTLTSPAEGAAALAGADVVVDGMLGIGGRPGLSAELERLIDAIPEDAYVVAVDLPSGADPAGEEPAVSSLFADETVTFGVAKPVHLLPGTEAATGRLTVVDIGLDEALAELGPTPAVERLTHDDVARLWPRPGPTDDKYSRGVLGVVAGGQAYTGAPVMTVTAAVESGAGMVRYVGTARPTDLVRAAVPEAVFGEGRVQAWVVGPGLDAQDDSGPGQEQVGAARRALGSAQPCLVDAGGLDLLDRYTLPRRAPTLLTPHAGELARLLGRLEGREISRQEVSDHPLRHARALADRARATVLLKGSTTLVVDPIEAGTPARAQADAPAWLATAGAGDVLAGVAGTLLAAGLDPRDAGSLAALVHGVAAHRANPGGPVRAMAVAHGIPAVVAHLLHRS